MRARLFVFPKTPRMPDTVLIPDWLLIAVIVLKMGVSLYEAWRRRDMLLALLVVPLGWLLLYFFISLTAQSVLTSVSDRQAVFRPGLLFLLLMNIFILIDGDLNCYTAGFLRWLRSRWSHATSERE